MNKTVLIEKIAAKAQLTKADAKKALDAATEAIKEALVDVAIAEQKKIKSQEIEISDLKSQRRDIDE